MPNGHEKNFVRLCAAIEGFRERYGEWPTRVRLFPGTLENLRSLFSAMDFETLNAKVQLVSAEASIVAEDNAGHSYDYGADGFPARRPEIRAAAWLGVQPKGHD